MRLISRTCALATLISSLSAPAGLAAIIAIAASPGVANAAVIIGNYPQDNDDLASTIASITGLFTKSAGFTMPLGASYSLDSVTVRLGVNDLAATIQYDLFGTSGGNPTGPSLVSFIIPALAVGTDNYTLLPGNPFVLQPGETYWVAATGSSPTPDGIVWRATSPGITPTGVATNAGYRFNDDGTYPPVGGSSVFNTYQVNGTLQAVPEPATLAMFGVLAAGALGVRRRLRARA
jgi:hypothetical protein